MAEPSNEALEMACKLTHGFYTQRVAAALQKLMAERDEARRVARVLAMESRPGAVKHHTAREWSDAVKTALAYPEVPHG